MMSINIDELVLLRGEAGTDTIVETPLPTRELCFLPTRSVFALHKAPRNSLSALL
jgi:hypothetical protein